MKTYLLIAAAATIQPVALLAQTLPAGAGFQQAQDLVSRGGIITMQPAMAGGRGGRGGAPMIGKPYSATAVTHTVQVLSDGSQIERTQSEVDYRDEQGRTRNETNEGKFIRIVDRVAGVAYSLDTVAKTAGTQEIMTGGRGANVVPRPVATTQPVETQLAQLQQLAQVQQQLERNTAIQLDMANHPKPTVEDLGAQSFNGVQAQGTRTTNTIPVGAIGNNRELKIVNERWDSKDLGLLIKSVNTDPRFGTTTYELTNLVQGAPDPSLFRVPADYTILPPPKRN